MLCQPLAQTAGKARRAAAGRDGQHQIAAPHDGRDMEIAELGNVLDIDQDARGAGALLAERRRNGRGPGRR